MNSENKKKINDLNFKKYQFENDIKSMENDPANDVLIERIEKKIADIDKQILILKKL